MVNDNMILKLTLRKMKNKKKVTLIMFLALFLSAFFLSSLTLYRDNQERYVQELHFQRYGKWQLVTSNQNKASQFEIIGTMSMIDSTQYGEIASFDQTMFELANIKLLEGNYPQNNHEIMVDTATLDQMKLPYQCHQTISLEIKGRKYEFTVAGIMFPYKNNWMTIDEMIYPSLITTSINAPFSYYFIFDQRINSSFLKTYEEDMNVYVNVYSYPSLQISSNHQDAENHIDSMTFLDYFIFMNGLTIIVTIFFQQIRKRKERIYHLCMIGVKDSFILNESICEGLLLCVTALPLAFLLSLIMNYGLFASFNTVDINLYYHINFIDVLCQFLCLGFSVITIFVILTMFILMSWNRMFKGKVKQRKKHRSMISIGLFLLVSMIVIVFVSVDTVCKWEFYTYALHDCKRDYDYTYFSEGAENFMGIYLENDVEVFKDIPIENFSYSIEGKTLKEIREMKEIYGIQSVEYGYIIPCVMSSSPQLNQESSAVVRFQAFPYTREQLADKGAIFTDEEYLRFMNGECAILAYEDNFSEDSLSKVDEFLLNRCDNQNKDLNETMYIQKEDNVVPIVLSSQKIIKPDYGTVEDSFNPRDLLVSEAFIEKYFHVQDGPYQYVHVRVSRDASYSVTDKKMSEYGLINKRIQKDEYLNRTQNEFYIAFIQCIIVYILIFAIFVNIWNGYLESRRKDIGVMQTIGVCDHYLFKKYWRKLIYMMIVCLLAAMLLEFYVNYQSIVPYVEKVDGLISFSWIPTQGIGMNGASIITNRIVAVNPFMRFSGLPIYLFVSVCIVLLSVSYILFKKALKDYMISKINDA